MKAKRRSRAEIHISEIDRFLADRMLCGETGPRGYTVSMKDRDGTLAVCDTRAGADALHDEGVDFELSPTEHLNLGDIGIEEYINRPLHTSSAYELFDLLFTHFSSFVCVVEFTGNAWKIRVIDPVPLKG